MTIGRITAFLCALIFLLPSMLFAQLTERADFSVLAGASKIPDTNLPTLVLPVLGTPVTSSAATAATFAVQANFGWRIWSAGSTTIFLELPFTIAPKEHDATLTVQSPRLLNSHDVVKRGTDPSYLVTPGVRFRILNKKISPYVAGGAGIEHATFQASTVTCAPTNCILIQENATRATKGVFDIGGGADISLFKQIAFRTEVRDYLRTGRAISESRQSLLFLAGLVIHLAPRK